MTSKYDEYLQAKAQAEERARFLALVTKPNCDKFGATVTLSDTYLGFYGSSGCSSWNGREVARELESMLVLAVERVAKRYAAKAERLRLEAQNEARAVLQEATTP